MITRRNAVFLLGAGVFAPFASFAQQSNKVRLVCVLGAGTPGDVEH